MISSIHIIGAKKSGGAERFFIRLTTSLAELGHPVHVIIPPGSEIDKVLPSHIDRSYIKMRNVYDIFSRFNINKTIKTVNPSVVQTYLGRATRLTHLPASGNIMHIARLGGYYNVKGYRHAHAWVANTQGIQDYLKDNGFPEQRVFQISNFVDTPVRHTSDDIHGLRERHSIPKNAICLLSVSRLHQNKAVDTLLTAFSQLPETVNGYPLHLLIVGAGPEENNLRDLSGSLEVHDRVHWAGWQNETSIFYQSCELFICPSRHEPLGNVILEAWSNKVPVITTATDGTKEIVTDNVNALQVPVDKPDQMADAILGLINDYPVRSSQLTKNAAETLAGNYHKTSIINAYLKMYSELGVKE